MPDFIVATDVIIIDWLFATRYNIGMWAKNIRYDIGEVREIETYQPHREAGIGPCMDICAQKELLYVIQRSSQYPGGRLCVLNADMQLLGEYVGIGNARQIKVYKNVAVVTAREDGLWILDVSTTQPVLLAHYHTLEFATGVTIYANFALVSCRQYGVEIVDISNPVKPMHIGIIRVGEVQSACVYNGYLYCGVWGGMSVIVVDIRNIMTPQIVNYIPLEGRGDGVFVREDKLYAVTGQHRRGIRNISNQADPCFGQGNGLVVLDISDPNQPKFLHSESFGKCYHIHFDMWKPEVYSTMVLSGCSSLGIFACDKDTYIPRFRVLLPAPSAETGKSDKRSAENVTIPHDAVTGFAISGSTLYICGGCTDLHIFEMKERQESSEEQMEYSGCQAQIKMKATQYPTYITEQDGIYVQKQYAIEDAPILGLCDCDDTIAIACGNAGIRLLDKMSYRQVTHLTAKGYCYDVKYTDGYLVAAMSDGGILISKKEKNELRIVSCIQTQRAVQQLSLSADGRYIVVGYGCAACRLYDITKKDQPRLVTERVAACGSLYGDNFTSGRLTDGTMLMFWHRDGLVYTNPSSGDLEFHSIFYQKSTGFMGLGPENGCDTDGIRIIYNLDGAYLFLPMKEHVNVDKLHRYRTKVPIVGKIVICGNYLVAAERAKGILTVTDISNVEEPQYIGRAVMNASPGKPVYIDSKILLPGGHGGLFEVCL